MLQVQPSHSDLEVRGRKSARRVAANHLPMPPIVIDIRNAEDARDVVHRAVQALAEGQIVAFPTETVYGLGASACRADAVERLVKAKGRPDERAICAGDQECRRGRPISCPT